MVIYIVTTNDLLSLKFQYIIPMYENDSVKNIRPNGINAIELRFLICLFTRDYKLLNKSDDYFEFLYKELCKPLKPLHPEKFKNLLQMELEYTKKLKLVDEKNELTIKGLTFVDLMCNGSYTYGGAKFEKVIEIYEMVLFMPVEDHSSLFPHLHFEEEEEEEGIQEKELIVNITLPEKEVANLIKKYDKGIWDKIKNK